MDLTPHEPDRPLPPIIAVPSLLDDDYRGRLLGLKNARVVEHKDHNYIDVGERTLVLVIDAREVFAGIQDGSLVAKLADMASQCEYPVLLIAGNLYGKPPVDVARSRCLAGFIAHLELFTRIRSIQTPDRFHAVMVMQLLAKQAQRGFRSLGLEHL